MAGGTAKGSASMEAASSVGSGARPGREEWPLLTTWLRQPSRSPRASTAASTSTSIAGESGAQPSSSARLQSEAHRPALRRAGDQHGLQRHVVGAVVAVAAGALGVPHHHQLRRAAQRLGDVGAEVVGALAVRPDLHRVAAASAPRRSRCRSRRGRGRAGRNAARCAAPARRPARLAALLHHAALAARRRVVEPGFQRRLLRQAVLRRPFGARGEARGRRLRVPLRLGEHGEEVAVADHARPAGQRPPSRSASSRARRAGGRTTRACSMPGRRRSCTKRGGAEHLVRQVEARHGRARRPRAPRRASASPPARPRFPAARPRPAPSRSRPRARPGARKRPSSTRIASGGTPLRCAHDADEDAARVGAGVAQRAAANPARRGCRRSRPRPGCPASRPGAGRRAPAPRPAPPPRSGRARSGCPAPAPPCPA